MVNRRSRVVQRQFRTLFNLGIIGELTDGQLLERFSTQSGEASELAFAALVERHGKMILVVCRNILHDPDDIQDAFQATFLVLVQKARSLWIQDSLGPWLHRVACRVSSRARASRAARKEHERRAAQLRPIAYANGSHGDDLAAALHQEIDRLPERFRAPLVLCDLEGFTHVRAARELGCPIGTIKSRLGRARDLLRGRLARRGLGLSSALVSIAVGSSSADAALLGAVVRSTVESVMILVSKKASGMDMISARAVKLKVEVMKTMLFTKLKVISAVLVVAGALASAAVGVLAQQGTGPRPGAPEGRAKAPNENRPSGVLRASSQPAPAYIRDARIMMITRLQEEYEAARNRLERTIRNSDPSVVQATEVVQDLGQLLARIDEVLVDSLRSHPTIFDFSSKPFAGAHGASATSKSAEASAESLVLQQTTSPGAMPKAGLKPDADELENAKTRAEWAEGMYKKGYVSREAADLERARYASAKQLRLGNRELATSILLQAALARARERAEWRERMVQKGFATKQQMEADQKDYENLQIAIRRAFDRIRWAESSFKMGFISQREMDSAYAEYEKLGVAHNVVRTPDAPVER